MGWRFRFKSKSNRNIRYVLSSRQHETQRYSLGNCMKLSTIHCITNNNYNDRGLQFTFKRNTYSGEGVPVESIHVSSRINSCVLNNPRMLVSKDWAFLRQTKRMPKITVLHIQLSFSGFAVLHSPCGSTETLWFGTQGLHETKWRRQSQGSWREEYWGINVLLFFSVLKRQEFFLIFSATLFARITLACKQAFQSALAAIPVPQGTPIEFACRLGLLRLLTGFYSM